MGIRAFPLPHPPPPTAVVVLGEMRAKKKVQAQQLTDGQLAELAGVERYRLRQPMPRSAPKAGVLSDLQRGMRSE